MNFTIVDVEQGSSAWHQVRAGRLTASRAADVVATLKSAAEPAARRDYRMQLVVERLTSMAQDNGFQSLDMKRGTELEPLARAAYEAQTGTMVTQVGFCAHTEVMAGASPDGVIDDFEGLLECKAPRSATHLRYLRDGRVPAEYVPQLTAQLWITGAQWVDFVSYDPLMPEPLQVFMVRHARDDDAIAAYEKKALAFLAEVDAEVDAVRTLMDLPGTLAVAVG